MLNMTVANKCVVDMKLSFGDLFTDGGHTILDYFNMTVYDTEFMLDVMSKSNINIQKVQYFPPYTPQVCGTCPFFAFDLEHL